MKKKKWKHVTRKEYGKEIEDQTRRKTMCGYSHLVAYLFIDYFRLYIVYQLLMISIYKGLSESWNDANRHGGRERGERTHTHESNVMEKQPAYKIIDAMRTKSQEVHIDELMAYNMKNNTWNEKEKTQRSKKKSYRNKNQTNKSMLRTI